MKVLALIFSPWALFALRGRYLLTIFIFFAQHGLVGWVVSIVGVITSREYKNFNELPKGAFPSIFFPFGIFFKQERSGLGVLSLFFGNLVSPLIILFALVFLDRIVRGYISEDMAYGVLGLSVFLWVVIWPCCAIFALKCVGMSSETQPASNTPLDSDSKSFFVSLLALEEAQRRALLKTKTPYKTTQIQAHLENLLIAQKTPLRKSIKHVLEELENV
ncbi:hypothetical protein [Helicobacter gastrocanis]|uniref:hypothetical protein n=1 Tax=Helicobacter gastrocanis TaxID=2849641 RepID=UPI001C85E4C6|nr:hypothetical protein [Helicobacter sp. NHP19-003]